VGGVSFIICASTALHFVTSHSICLCHAGLFALLKLVIAPFAFDFTIIVFAISIDNSKQGNAKV